MQLSKTSLYNILLISLFFIFAALNWEAFVYFNNPAKRITAQHDGNPILFSADWCQYCKIIRNTFTEHDIAFIEYDIDKSNKGKRQFNDLEGKGVPLLLVKGEIIPGFNPGNFKKLVNDLRL